MGHSFGGKLVAELAARHPDRVERAVLLDPAMHIQPDVAGERADGTRADVSFASADEAIDARLARRLALLDSARDPRGGGARASRRGARRPPPLAVVAGRGDRRLERDGGAGAAVAAAARRSSSRGERSWITNRVPRIGNIAHVLVPGGHSVLWDDFDATADAIVRFLG